MSTARCTMHPDAEAEASCARCGDFMCRLCGPLEPVPLCVRCVVKSTVDWEERGEQSVMRAFVRTFRDSVGSPSRVGKRLGGSGHGPLALGYAAICGITGLTPLSLLGSSLLVNFADPMRLGLRSTGVLSVAVFLVLGAVALSTLFAAGLALWTSFVWGASRLSGGRARYDVLLRASCYGASLIGLPLLGPLLWPAALVGMLLAVRAALKSREQAPRADFALAGSLGAFAMLGYSLYALASR